MPTIYHYFAAILAPRSVPHYIKTCGNILTKMSGDATYGSPPVAYTQVEDDLDALLTSEQATRNGPRGAAADRDAKLKVMRAHMRLLKAFVQSLADADVARSQVLIEGSGMSVARKAVRTKPDFEARAGHTPATVDLACRAVKARRVTYFWQMSKNQVDWADLPETLRAKASVSGLTTGTTYFFRFRTLTHAGLSAWSAVVTIVAT